MGEMGQMAYSVRPFSSPFFPLCCFSLWFGFVPLLGSLFLVEFLFLWCFRVACLWVFCFPIFSLIISAPLVVIFVFPSSFGHVS